MGSYKLIKNENMFKGKIVSVERDIITLPTGQETMRETVIHNGGAAIIAIDDDSNIIFVRQYRHAVKSYILEIPAGLINKNESPAACAARELKEETGYKAKDIKHITSLYSSVGFCNEIISIYLGKNLVKGTQCLDEGEYITLEKYSLNTAINMIFSGEIKDGKTIVAILAYKEMLQR